MDLRKLSTYQAGIMQSSAHRALGVFVTRLLQPHGLTMMQWFVLGLIHDAGKTGMRMTTLAEQLNTTMAFVTNHINRLESMGLVTRTVDAIDTRARIVKLEPAARKKVEKIETELRAGMREGVYSLVSTEELLTYLKVLSKFAAIEK